MEGNFLEADKALRILANGFPSVRAQLEALNDGIIP
jgi:hypothetical protein